MTTLAHLPGVVDDDDDIQDPADLDDDELFDEIFTKPGLDILTNIVLLARGYQHGSPIAVLMKALIVSALSEPMTVFHSGTAETPLNLQIGFVGASGRGKGRAMSAPIMPANGATWRKETPASGEALVASFFDTDIDDEGKKIVKRHNEGVWAEWKEIDGYAAKAGKSNGTHSGGGSSASLDSHIRSLITGEEVGDKSLTREKQGVGSRLDELSYRSVVTFGVQPTRAHPLVKDGGGGTLQRTIWVDVTDPHCPRKAPAIRAVRDQLAQRLGLTSTPAKAPTLLVVGPAEVIVQPHIQDMIMEDVSTVMSGSDEIADEDTHMNNLTVRLAAMLGGWVVFEKRTKSVPQNLPNFGGGVVPQSITSIVDDAEWWWARCVMELSRRARSSISTSARKGIAKEMQERGVQDAERHLARERRLAAETEMEARKTLERICTVLRGAGGEMDERRLRNSYLSKNQRNAYRDARDIGEMEGLLDSKAVTGVGTVIVLDNKSGW